MQPPVLVATEIQLSKPERFHGCPSLVRPWEQQHEVCPRGDASYCCVVTSGSEAWMSEFPHHALWYGPIAGRKEGEGQLDSSSSFHTPLVIRYTVRSRRVQREVSLACSSTVSTLGSSTAFSYSKGESSPHWGHCYGQQTASGRSSSGHKEHSFSNLSLVLEEYLQLCFLQRKC
ncbi:uncharacterized protein J5F26_002856 isoform 1-T2 [Ciconia maguari]